LRSPFCVAQLTTSNVLPSHTILDGKVHVFMRDGSPYWWAGFHYKGKYLRTSTKQRDERAADAMASQWYFQKQTEIASGQVATAQHAFEKLAKAALENYKTVYVDRGVRSQKTYDGIEGIMNSRVVTYFKKMPVTAIDNTAWHEYKDAMIAKYPLIKRGTLHQYKNAIRVVLNYAYKKGLIAALPEFKDEYSKKRIDTPRPWFTSAEYTKLHSNILAHAKHSETRDKLQFEYAMELYDHVIFATNTGMRVGEMLNCKFSDVRIVKEQLTGKEVLVISNIKGKRGTGTCQSYYGAVEPFKRLMKRRGIKDATKCDELLFRIHHRTLFNTILAKTGLKFSNSNPPAKRDFVSLRATYICFRLLNGVPIYEIANNCRTSVAVIQESYARHLGGQLMPNINRTNVRSKQKRVASDNGVTEGWDY